MSKKKMQEYHELADRFIVLANQMKNEGKPIELVNAALMSASGYYSTFTAVGNDKALTQSGIDKIVAVYKQNLENVQKFKAAQGEINQPSKKA